MVSELGLYYGLDRAHSSQRETQRAWCWPCLWSQPLSWPWLLFPSFLFSCCCWRGVPLERATPAAEDERDWAEPITLLFEDLKILTSMPALTRTALKSNGEVILSAKKMKPRSAQEINLKTWHYNGNKVYQEWLLASLETPHWLTVQLHNQSFYSCWWTCPTMTSRYWKSQHLPLQDSWDSKCTELHLGESDIRSKTEGTVPSPYAHLQTRGFSSCCSIHRPHIEELVLKVFIGVVHGWKQSSLSVAAQPDLAVHLSTRLDLGLTKDLKKSKEHLVAARSA